MVRGEWKRPFGHLHESTRGEESMAKSIYPTDESELDGRADSALQSEQFTER